MFFDHVYRNNCGIRLQDADERKKIDLSNERKKIDVYMFFFLFYVLTFQI